MDDDQLLLTSVHLYISLIKEYMKMNLQINNEMEEFSQQMCTAYAAHIESMEALISAPPEISERRFRKKPTFENIGWWEDCVPKMPEDVFKENFRMERATFASILELMHGRLLKEDTPMQKAIPPAKRIAIALKVLGTNTEYKEVGIMFGVGKTTVHDVFKDFVAAAKDILVPKFIVWPSNQQFTKIAEDFESRWQYPMAVGAIDGCHIPISVPENLATDYYNFKGWHSILSIAICDANYKFYYVKTGIPGRANDAGAFSRTWVWEKGESGGLFPESHREIDGTVIPYHLLGDSAFALKKWLIKPYLCGGESHQDRRIFNYRHSRARRVIENAFGRCKARFRRIAKRLQARLEDCADIVLVCFALHNICEQAMDEPVPSWIEDGASNDATVHRPNQPQRDAEMIRDVLKAYLNEASQPWFL